MSKCYRHRNQGPLHDCVFHFGDIESSNVYLRGFCLLGTFGEGVLPVISRSINVECLFLMIVRCRWTRRLGTLGRGNGGRKFGRPFLRAFCLLSYVAPRHPWGCYGCGGCPGALTGQLVILRLHCKWTSSWRHQHLLNWKYSRPPGREEYDAKDFLLENAFEFSVTFQ